VQTCRGTAEVYTDSVSACVVRARGQKSAVFRASYKALATFKTPHRRKRRRHTNAKNSGQSRRGCQEIEHRTVAWWVQRKGGWWREGSHSSAIVETVEMRCCNVETGIRTNIQILNRLRSLVWPPTNHPTTAASSPPACFVWLVAQPARFTQLPTRTCSLISSVRPVECEWRTGAVSVRHGDLPAAQQCMHGHELVLPQLVRAQTSSPLRSLRVPAARQRSLTGRAGVCCAGRARMR